MMCLTTDRRKIERVLHGMLTKTPDLNATTAKLAPRILFYSHDTFGLGHIRRTRTIAMALAEANPGASILIVTGSPIVGRFDFPDGVDFVRIPGVVKLSSGDYVTHNMNLEITQTVKLRRAIIRQTARVFDPDLVIVDKEPTGFRGEMLHTLKKMRERGAKIVLGVRDVLDEPEALAKEWKRKKAIEAVETYYDELWVYGLEDIYNPLKGIALSDETLSKVFYTGYLRRQPADWPDPSIPRDRPEDFVLVTPGGGGDGDTLIDWTLSAYESDPSLSIPAVIVFGPFMKPESRRAFERRAHRFRTIETISFDSRIERLMIEAKGVIAMGGYNTFCEILSFDKPAAIAPRVSPRLEQYIRAEAAEKFGLIHMLPPVDNGKQPDPRVMADAIRALTKQSPPSKAAIPGLLEGLDRVVERAGAALAEPRT